MWRVDGAWLPWRRKHVLLHASRHTVRWLARDGSTWQCLTQAPIDGGSLLAMDALHDALAVVAQAHDARHTDITVALDSVWMPVSWVPSGTSPLSPSAFETWARHRLVQTYGASLASWGLRTTYLAGDPGGLVFAASPSLQAWAQGQGTGRWHLTPSLVFAQNELGESSSSLAMRKQDRHSLCQQTALLEDDRMILVTRRGRRIVGCHPALPLPACLDEASLSMARERRRLGIWRAPEQSGSEPAMQVMALRAQAGWPLSTQVDALTPWHLLSTRSEVPA